MTASPSPVSWGGLIRAYANEAAAAQYLAGELAGGTLGVMIGAGTSVDVGLPNWRRLVIRCCIRSGVGFPELRRERQPSADLLQTIIGRVERQFTGRPNAYRELVRECLYHRVHLNMDLIRLPLLIALGAMVSGSARGSVSDVITFNFDNIFEWYLRLHGYRVRVISDLPALTGGEDVRIYQMQGYLPHQDTERDPSDFLIFSAMSVDEKIGDRLNPWQETFRQIFLSKIVVIIGMSEASARDRVIGPVLANLAPVLGPSRPTAFWIFGHPISDDDREALFQRNVVPVELPSHAAIPRFLLNICQLAGGGKALTFGAAAGSP